MFNTLHALIIYKCTHLVLIFFKYFMNYNAIIPIPIVSTNVYNNFIYRRNNRNLQID